MNTKYPMSTDYILQATVRKEDWCHGFRRKSKVENQLGLVGEYPS